MTKEQKKQAGYRPSASAFVSNNLVVTKSNSACIRYIQTSNAVEEKPFFDPIYQDVGAHDEEQYFIFLKNKYGDKNVLRELPISSKIGNTNTEFRGRSDFAITDEQGKIVKIYEKKSCISSSSRLNYIRKGIPSINNVAQLVSYLIVLGVSKGALVFNYYAKDLDGNLVSPESRTYEIEVKSDGSIDIDGEVFRFNANHLLEHMLLVAKHLESGKLAERPANAYEPFNSPCSYCSIRDTCDKLEFRQINEEEFYNVASAEVKRRNAEPQRIVVIPKLTKKRGNTNGFFRN